MREYERRPSMGKMKDKAIQIANGDLLQCPICGETHEISKLTIDEALMTKEYQGCPASECPASNGETVRCLHHSPMWMMMVEHGWVTSHVDGDGWAHMVKTEQ